VQDLALAKLVVFCSLLVSLPVGKPTGAGEISFFLSIRSSDLILPLAAAQSIGCHEAHRRSCSTSVPKFSRHRPDFFSPVFILQWGNILSDLVPCSISFRCYSSWISVSIFSAAVGPLSFSADNLVFLGFFFNSLQLQSLLLVFLWSQPLSFNRMPRGWSPAVGAFLLDPFRYFLVAAGLRFFGCHR
jgi:hypothetical protein